MPSRGVAMDPYRRPVVMSAPDSIPVPDDEGTVLKVAFVTGVLPVVMAILTGAVWGFAPTVGLLVCVLVARALALRARERRREDAAAAGSASSRSRAGVSRAG